MNKLHILFLMTTLLLFFLLYTIWKTRRENKFSLEKIDKMLESAKSGNLKVEKYDESMLSKIELSFQSYLLNSQDRLDKLSEEKERLNSLISDISHQIKTPLSNVILYTQLLNESDDLNRERNSVELIHNQAEKLDFLTNSLIKISRLETGLLKLNPKLNNIENLILNVKNQIYHQIEMKEIQLVVEQTNEMAVFDLKWTEEVLYNILDNAIKYSEKNSTVEIKVRGYEFFSRIDIIDNGIGINEEEINQIFQRFYRSKNVSETKGIGIGLYLSRKILEEESGYIKVNSIEEKGSIFSIFLPKELNYAMKDF